MMIDFDTLPSLSRSEIVAHYQAVLGEAPPKRIGRKTLAQILAWEVQAKKQGGLKKRVRNELKRLAEGDIRKTPSTRIRSGTRLLREWNGVTHVVDVEEKGVRYKGKSYTSLTAIAEVITGVHWSGPRFFGLKS